jgi:hypothetical protein
LELIEYVEQRRKRQRWAVAFVVVLGKGVSAGRTK